MIVTILDILKHLDDKKVDYNFIGDKDTEIAGFSSLNNYKCGTFTWVKSQKNWDIRQEHNSYQLLFVQEGVIADCPNQIITQTSKFAFFETIEHFFDTNTQKSALGAGTYISPDVHLGDKVRIGANCTLDGHISIGDNTIIENNVTIQNNVVIGKQCIIQSGCRIGIDGFAYTEDTEHNKTMVRHYGGVLIGNDVYIGANCVIDRGQIDDTIIGDGCKFDPIIHIAHNVVYEKNCTTIAGSMVMGSVHVCENAYISSAIIRNQCTIGKNAIIGMGAVVTCDVPPDITVVGIPAKEFKK